MRWHQAADGDARSVARDGDREEGRLWQSNNRSTRARSATDICQRNNRIHPEHQDRTGRHFPFCGRSVEIFPNSATIQMDIGEQISTTLRNRAVESAAGSASRPKVVFPSIFAPRLCLGNGILRRRDTSSHRQDCKTSHSPTCQRRVGEAPRGRSTRTTDAGAKPDSDSLCHAEYVLRGHGRFGAKRCYRRASRCSRRSATRNLAQRTTRPRESRPRRRA